MRSRRTRRTRRTRLTRLAGCAGGSLAMLLLAAGAGAAGGRVYERPEAVEPLAAGSAVPSVRVETVRGEPVELAGLLRERGALLVFYRGGW